MTCSNSPSKPVVFAVIPARGGSRGIPGKNVIPVAGKPLIGWTIEAAMNSPSLFRTVLSTDDEHITRVAVQCGAEVPFARPKKLATDTCTNMDVVRHALDWFERDEGLLADLVLLLQPTSPFRTSEDIEAAINLATTRNADGVVSVCRSKVHPAKSYRIRYDGKLDKLLSPEVAKELDSSGFVLNGAIYLVTRDVLVNGRTFLPKNTYGYIMPPNRSVDIDVPWDLRFAEYLQSVA